MIAVTGRVPKLLIFKHWEIANFRHGPELASFLVRKRGIPPADVNRLDVAPRGPPGPVTPGNSRCKRSPAFSPR
mgnify:FL=1